MPTKFGIQLHNGSDLPTVQVWLEKLRPKAVLAVDQPELLDIAYATLGATAYYLFRRDSLPLVEDYIEDEGGNIEQAVKTFMADIESDIVKLRWAYHLTPRANQLTPETATFDALAIEYAYDLYNLRMCAGNFIQPPTDWSNYQRALEAAADFHALIGIDERYPMFPYVGYGPNANIPDVTSADNRKLVNPIPYPQQFTQVGSFVGRYRSLRDYCRTNHIPVKILITDSGAGRVLPNWLDAFEPKLGGWQTLKSVWQRLGIREPEKQYAKDLIWLDQSVYHQDQEVVATCLATLSSPQKPQAEIIQHTVLLNALQGYMNAAHQNQSVSYAVYTLKQAEEYRVEVRRLRIREAPNMNNKYLGAFEFGDKFEVENYTFNDGFVWVQHRLGWSAFAPLIDGKPYYTASYLSGTSLYTPKQLAAANNFVGSIEEVRKFLAAHTDHIFYIAIDPDQPPEGARQFRITTFPAGDARRIINELHPAPDDPLITPRARLKLRKHKQL